LISKAFEIFINIFYLEFSAAKCPRRIVERRIVLRRIALEPKSNIHDFLDVYKLLPWLIRSSVYTFMSPKKTPVLLLWLLWPFGNRTLLTLALINDYPLVNPSLWFDEALVNKIGPCALLLSGAQEIWRLRLRYIGTSPRKFGIMPMSGYTRPNEAYKSLSIYF